MRTGDGDTYPNQYDSPKLKQMVLGAGTPILGITDATRAQNEANVSTVRVLWMAERKEREHLILVSPGIGPNRQNHRLRSGTRVMSEF